MNIPKILPPWLFQILASLLISAYISLNIYWYINNSGLYRIINSLFGEESNEFSGLVNVLAALLIIIVFIILLRSLAKMPNIKDQIASDFDESNEDKLKSKKEIRLSGTAICLAGIPFLLLGIWLFLQNMEQGFFLIFDIILIVLGFFLFIIGIIQMIIGKRILKKKK